jgi:hypothetical protein
VRRSRLAAPVIALGFGVVMAAACSSGGGLAVHPPGHATTSATPNPHASATAIPTGTQLGKLLGEAVLPAGWKHAQGVGNGMQNSGSMNATATGPPPAEYTCKYLDSSVQAGYILGWYSASNASMILTYPSEPANLPEVNLTVAAYPADGAAKNMAKAAALMGRCRSFRDPGEDHDRDQTSVTTIPHLGDRNLFLTSKEYTGNAGTLTGQLLLIQDGNYILAVSNGISAVRPATVQGFGGWLVQLLDKSTYAG